ncbi:uncharacterized protein G6M90_00g093520 [Metarhizium brunneum]|uniref:Uncharacterized protein n=1 Tax=Metarhizium brunneum TaxID=500148 RepID=A0A7D5Z9X4_9HYPO|nr:hypothetical protein G6M90_00g093520 [Metarhizium brunneum]
MATQFLDFEHERQLDVKILGSAVLQFARAVKLKQDDTFVDMLHTIEPELSVQKDVTMATSSENGGSNERPVQCIPPPCFDNNPNCPRIH